jgi:hypothetical protein
MTDASAEPDLPAFPSRKYTLAQTGNKRAPVPGTAMNTAMAFSRRGHQREKKLGTLETVQAAARARSGGLAAIVARGVVDVRRRREDHMSPVRALQGILQERRGRHRMGRAYDQRVVAGSAAARLPQIDGGVLFKEAKRGHVVVVKQMLLSSSDDEAQISRGYDEIGNTALHVAARLGSVAMLRVLLMFGAESNAQNNLGQTPMHLAWSSWQELSPASMFRPAQMCSVESLIELLMQYGADPNLHDAIRAETPLHIAAEFGHPKIAKRLIKFGANHEKRSAGKDGKTPLAMAEKAGTDSPPHRECAMLMKNWRLIRRELKHVEVRARGQAFLSDPTVSPQRTQSHDAIALDMAASDLALFAKQTTQRTQGLRMDDGTHGGGLAAAAQRRGGTVSSLEPMQVSPVKRRGQQRVPKRAIRASAKRQQERLQMLQPRYGGGGGGGGSGGRIGQKFHPKRRLGALRRRAGVATEIMSDIHYAGGNVRPAATSPIARRSPASVEWGRRSSRQLEGALAAQEKAAQGRASKKKRNDDNDGVKDGGETLELQRFRFNDSRALPPACEGDTPSVQLWWNRGGQNNNTGAKSGGDGGSGGGGGGGGGGGKRGAANSVKRMYFDLSQLSAPWNPPGGQRGISYQPKQNMFESSTVCASTRF